MNLTAYCYKVPLFSATFSYIYIRLLHSFQDCHEWFATPTQGRRIVGINL